MGEGRMRVGGGAHKEHSEGELMEKVFNFSALNNE